MNIEDIIKRFDYKIMKEIKYMRREECCNSYWEKQLFIETLNLTIEDWAEIRAGDYFSLKDSLSTIDQNKFTYKKVMDYVLSRELVLLIGN
tara:strand:+ start:220 stop:492 length:273 start_codon:yes stop_codon:yes gene_type:complete